MLTDVFFKYVPSEKNTYRIFSKEFFILINNWFMIFFLTVVLIGTLYPVFLDTLIGEKISVGPPYYNFILAPFLIPLLFLTWVVEIYFLYDHIHDP